jgi:glucose/arabinose dehydrogenase
MNQSLKILVAIVVVTAAFILSITKAEAVEWPQIFLVDYAGGLTQPVHITNAGDSSRRLFVVEQPGRIKVIKNGTLLSAPFLDITGRVLSGGERGLLSVAFPPGYAAKGRFYVNYTRVNDGATVISRYTLTANPDVADPGSEQIILTIPQPFANHNGGQIAFGPDGFLYIGMGDGGSGGDPLNNAQNPASLLGKMLRIDVESAVVPYSVPLSNPFLNSSGFLPEIWALGLRNPWRFSFDMQTGDLYIADVGQNSFEEVDLQPAVSAGGENYGWRIMEGSRCFNPSQCDPAGLALPVAGYDHLQGDCSVTGGFVYRGLTFARMKGIYFFGDFCTGRIRGLQREGVSWQTATLLDSTLSITTFGNDEDGELYVADHGSGNIFVVADTVQGIPLPSGGQTFPYPPSVSPAASIIPGIAKPVGVGLVAAGGTFVEIRVSMGQFSGPVDVFGARLLPGSAGILQVLNPDLTFQPISVDGALQALSTGVLPASIRPWKAGVNGPLEETVFGPISVSGLSPGTHQLFFLVTPAGDFGAYYLWRTSFVAP